MTSHGMVEQVTELGNNAYMRSIAEADLPLILEWRNHPMVRSVMFTDQVISSAEHLAWWGRIQSDPSRSVLLFYYQDIPVGIVNYFDIDTASGTCHWGFYLDNASTFVSEHRLAIWLALEEAAIRYAFNTIGSRELLCETFEFNKEVLLIHRKFGFQEVTRTTADKQGVTENVVVMSLKNASPRPASRPREKAMGIAFLGSANWDLIAGDFASGYHTVTGDPVDLFPVPFGQYHSMLLDEKSALRQSELEYYLFCERIEDFLTSPFVLLDSSDTHFQPGKFEQYLRLIESARTVLPGTFFILDLAPSRPLVATNSDSYYVDGSVREKVAQLNRRLEEFCSKLPDCHVIRLSALMEEYGAGRAAAGKYWHLGRMAYSTGFGMHLTNHLTGVILALRGKTARVLVLDLDNTLWGGVVGDDGIKGIQVGGDYPGSLFAEMQHCIASFKERGVALALCSKNTEAIALEAIDSHPGMLLRSGDFIARRINWQDKADNIREIAAEIGVGLSSLCFIDDSPYEREAIRRQLPEVLVPEMPPDVSQWPAFLCSHPFLAAMYLTREDKERIERYKARARILSESETFTSKEEYWRSLEMNLTFHRLHEGNQQRVLQLLVKTNQFNMTTRRYNEQDVRGIIERGGFVIPVGLSDKYSPHEVIGVVILIPETPSRMVIDTFLLSCRVLGRSVETGILGWICEFARNRRYETLAGLFTRTDRNAPASGVYREHGFIPNGSDSVFELPLAPTGLTIPAWFSVQDEVS